MSKRILVILVVTGLFVLLVAAPALASDHLFNAAHSSGVDNRGFANPVAANPSGVSGAMAKPAIVPGEGSPNAGIEQGTPSVNLGDVFLRSGGHGMPQKP
jgi:hypothetical protein